MLKKNIAKTSLAAIAMVGLASTFCFAEATTPEEAEKAMSPECRKFAADPDADIGEIIKAGCKPTLAQMSALMDNPLGNVAMLFTQFDFYRMTNDAFTDETAVKSNYMGIAQFPKKLGKNWNLINRIVWTVPSMPLDQDKIDSASGQTQPYSELQGSTLPPVDSQPLPINLFDGRTTGFGDMYYVGLFAPTEGIKMGEGSFLWGAGFDLGFATATDDILGTGKWTAGPSALAVYMGPKWKVGGLLQQYWDYAGPSDRDNVNMTNFQYFIYYSLNETTSIGAGPNIIANWQQDSDDRFTVPIGIGISKTIQIGKVPVRFGIEAHYSVIQPDNVPSNEWDYRFYIIPAIPSALFDWMN